MFADYLNALRPEDAARARQTFMECLKGQRKTYYSEERAIWPDGSVHWLETHGRGCYGPDRRALRVHGVVRDVTERKLQQQMVEQLATVYATSFTVDELKQIEAFYKQPVGQKLLSKDAALEQAATQIGQDGGRKAADDLRTRLTQALRQKGRKL
jgi:hypothetical protein